MKIVVTGSKGQLGSDVVEFLLKNNIECIGADLPDIDITDEKEISEFLFREKPDAVMHFAAFTDVDAAEENRDECKKINCDGTLYIAKACEKINAALLYTSTDYVFDNSGENFSGIDSPVNPVNYYGLTKYQGEEIIRKNCSKYFIVRISWVFGENGKNFIKTMLRLSEEKDSISVVDDQIGSPTYTKDLAPLLCSMVFSDKYGVYHATNEGVCSWAQLAKYVFDVAGKNTTVTPIKTAEYPSRAQRPLNSRLSKSSLDSAGFDRLPSWQDAVRRFLTGMNCINNSSGNTTADSATGSGIFDEIMDKFQSLAETYSDFNAEKRFDERKKAFSEKSEIEMQGIREDIERRYSQQLEKALKNHDSIAAGELPASETGIQKEPEVFNITVLTGENEEKSDIMPDISALSVPENQNEESFSFNGKSSLYKAVYSLGDCVTKIISTVFRIIVFVITFPFIFLRDKFRLLTKDLRLSRKKAKMAFIKEMAVFRFEIRTSSRAFRKAIAQPKKLPGVISHYTKKALINHRGLFKSIFFDILPVASLVVLITAFSSLKSLTFALEVIYDGESIGYISDESVFLDAKDKFLERTASQSLPEGSSSQYALAIVSLDKLSDANTISDKMVHSSIDNLTDACGVYIDGRFICAVKNETDAKTVFYNILEPYEQQAEEEGYVIGFAEKIDYIQGAYADSEDIIWEPSKLESVVAGEKGNTMVYIISESDTVSSICDRNSVTEQMVQQANPDYDLTHLVVGDRILLPVVDGLVNIKKTMTTTSVRTVKYSTERKKDPSKYSGFFTVLQKGVDGSERVTKTVTYINGEMSGTEYSFDTLVEPVNEVVMVGSMTSYNGVYIGEASDYGFLWPAPHCRSTSSGYGWRSSGWHKGIDLCTGNGTAYGSPVIAAKSGRVEVVQRSMSGYGQMVLINHGDGFKTRYAHMVVGSITVSVGEYVEAGQQIGKVGSTGNSSGPHLHFEVIYNGELKDPSKYISR
ncbi:MAG: dTDP-4-dehydrorhamnose reductase [Clostridiales bacterium]|nr:dTDP-4-dehydrorhamnose reductase [Clostridiales bacterium]